METLITHRDGGVPVAPTTSTLATPSRTPFDEGFAEGIALERGRFDALMKIAAGDPAFVAKQFLKGTEVAKAAEEYIPHLRAQIAGAKGRPAKQAKGEAAEHEMNGLKPGLAKFAAALILP